MERTRLLFYLFIVFLIAMTAGCEDLNPVAKVGDGMIGAYERSSVTAGQASLKSIKDAIRIYHISNGEYPASLEEIQKLMGSRIDIGLYEYDSDSGEITLL